MKNQIFKDNAKERRPLTVGNKVAPGTPLITAQGPGITVTGSGDNEVKSEYILPDGTAAEFVERTRGGASLADDEATVTFSGSYAFVFPGSEDAEAGDEVLLSSTGELSINDGSGTDPHYGVVEFVRPADGAAVVKIGV